MSHIRVDTKFLITSYNYYIRKSLQRIRNHITYPSDAPTTRYVFTEVKIQAPVYADSGRSVVLYPAFARNSGRTYGSTMYATVRQEQADRPVNSRGLALDGKPVVWQQVGDEYKNLNIGTIPVMLGSNICHLDIAKTTDKSRVEKGMAQGDPLGYFIVEGKEKVIIGQDYQRMNRITLLSMKDGNPEVRVLSPNPEGGGVLTKIVEAKNTAKRNKALTSEGAEVLELENECMASIRIFKTSDPKIPRAT